MGPRFDMMLTVACPSLSHLHVGLVITLSKPRIRIIANWGSRALTGVKRDHLSTLPSALHHLRGERSLPHGHRSRSCSDHCVGEAWRSAGTEGALLRPQWMGL
jgi:hypothetical protein